MKIYLYIFSAFFLSTLNGCIATNSMQSGRTVGKDIAEASFSITEGKYMSNFADENKTDLDFVPVFDGGVKYGVLENFDVAFKISTSSFLSGQIKWQFLGNKESLIAASIGAEAGIIIVSEEITYWNTSIPLYLSVHPTDKLAFYVTPRLCRSNRFIHKTPEGQGYIKSGYWTYGDLSYGIIFGKEHKFILEITHSGRNSMLPTQVSLGYAFNLNFDYKKHSPRYKMPF